MNKLNYSTFGKSFEKQIKTIEDEGKNQVDALKDLKLEDQTKSAERFLEKDHESNEIKNGLYKIKRHENKAIRDNFLYE